MKKEKTKPIPKYIVARIKKADTQNNVCLPGRTRFYSYLTKNDGELVKVTVAVRTRYKQWLYKQVAVHGLNSDICYVKDMVFHYIAGYSVGWFEQGRKPLRVGMKAPNGIIPKINISTHSPRSSTVSI